MKHILYILAIVIPILTSCRHEEENVVISIYQPAANSSFDVFDTIHYKFSLQTSNAGIKDIFVYISDRSQQVTSLQRSESYEGNYIINSSGLSTGNYYFTVQVNTTKNVYKAFREIGITGIPRRLEYIISFSGNTLIFLNQNFEEVMSFSLSGEILDIQPVPCGNYNAEVTFMPQVMILFADGTVQTFKIDDYNGYSLEIMETNVLNGITDLNMVKFYKHDGDASYPVFLPKYNNFTKYLLCSYTAVNSPVFDNSYQRPVKFLQDSNYVYVACKSTSTTTGAVFYVYHLSDLSYYKSFSLEPLFYPANIIKAGEDNYWLFGNINNQGCYYDIYTSENTFYLNDLSEYGNIYFATPISYGNTNNGILFSAESGLYMLTNNGIWQIADISPQCFTREEISNSIFMCDSTNGIIYKYDISTENVEQVASGYSYIKFLYNK